MSLSYQHSYHAGNLADVHKHLWLVAVLDYLLQKEKPLCWVDAHGGRGVYDLYHAHALKTGEASEGILKAATLLQGCIHPLWQRYITLCCHPDMRYYAGSPLIAAKMLRSHDKLVTTDLHPQEVSYLQQSLAPYPTAHILKEDMVALCQRLPLKECKRGGVLFDPSYDIKSEYDTVPKTMLALHQRWQNAVLMLWYPMLPAGRHEQIKELLSRCDAPLLLDEWQFSYMQGKERGMSGAGIAILNPPYTVPDTMQQMREVMQAAGLIL